MLYLIRYLDSRGEPSTIKLDAGSRQEARLVCRIPERRIMNVREDILGRIAQNLESGVPGLKNQAIFLQNLSSAFATGKPVKEATLDLIQQSSWLRIKQERLDQCEELADFLRLLRFDQNSILLAETAKRTGQYALALRKASRYLIDKERVGSEVAKEVRMGLVYIILGFVFFTVMPFFLDYAIAEISAAVGSHFTGNKVTRLLVFWGQFMKNGWPIIVILMPVIYYFRELIALSLRCLPLFSTIHYKKVLDRSFRFLSAYDILNEAEIVDSKAILALLEASDGEDRAVFRRIYARLVDSENLASAFSQEDWPMVVREAVAHFGQVNAQQKRMIIETVKETVEIENLHIARSLAQSLSRIGFCMMLLAVIGAAIGFYVPLANMASSFGA